jgi:Xaa-Pro aminopeptidase
MPANLQDTRKGPSLSLKERNRRYSAIRARMKERGIGALIVGGSNLTYLSNGLPGELFGVLPAEEGEEFTSVLIWRYLVDIPPNTLRDAQDWVTDYRGAKNPNVTIVERLKELKLESGTVAYAGRFGHSGYNFIMRQLPSLKIVDASDILEDIRTLKSDEEIALIDHANSLFNLAVEAIHHKARPGMLGREVVQIGLNAMFDGGADHDATFSLNFGPHPKQNPILAWICLDQRIKEGDVATLTSHPHFRHYAGHTDQEIVFGSPSQLHLKMFDSVKKVHSAVVSRVKAGVTQRDLIEAYEAACRDTGFQTCEHSQIHQYGIEVPEFPGPAFKTADTKGGKGLGSAGNFTLKSGMIYSISPVLIDGATEDLILGGTTMAVTDTGFRELGKRPVELLVVG